MYDVVIRDAKIVDGTGNPWFFGTVAIRGGVIEDIWRSPPRSVVSQRTIRADDLILCPGIIDVHGHSDFTILTNPRADNLASQGITTQGVGQCGFSTYGFSDEHSSDVKNLIRSLAPEAFKPDFPDWRTLEEWRSIVQGEGTAINLAPYIGHNVLRCSAMGQEGDHRIDPKPEELDTMKNLLHEGLEHGAFGLSTGLRYPFGRNADTSEVEQLLTVVAEFGGVHISHMRSEEEYLLHSVAELIDASEATGVPSCASHHKAMFFENWGTPSISLHLMKEARDRGVDVLCDLYPWNYARQINLGRYFVDALTRDTFDPSRADDIVDVLVCESNWMAVKDTLIREAQSAKETNEERQRVLWSRGVYAPSLWDSSFFDCVVHSPSHPEFVGKNFSQIARALSLDDHWEAMRTVYIKDHGATLVAAGPISEQDVRRILSHPLSMVGTDAEARDTAPKLESPFMSAHPRGWGTYPKVLGKYVREEKLITVEEAIRKMTSLPARFLGIDDRGMVKPGLKADLLLFDPETIDSRATYARPCEKPSGIHSVFVNGHAIISDGQSRDAYPGQVLSRR